jgi:hypothetical protein
MEPFLQVPSLRKIIKANKKLSDKKALPCEFSKIYYFSEFFVPVALLALVPFPPLLFLYANLGALCDQSMVFIPQPQDSQPYLRCAITNLITNQLPPGFTCGKMVSQNF